MWSARARVGLAVPQWTRRTVGVMSAADGDGDVVVEDLGDLGQGGDLGVVEGVDAPEDVVAGAMSHEAPPHRVFDAGSPGQVGGAALAEQVGGDAEAEVVAGDLFGRGGFLEGMAVGVLAGAVGIWMPGTSRAVVSMSPVSGSVWKASMATRSSSIILGGTTRTREPAAVLSVGL